MKLPPAPGQYLRDIWQSVLNEIRREDLRNVKRDAPASFGGAANFTSAIQLSGDITPTQITADQNDYDPSGLSTASVLRLASDAARNITGLAGGADGRLMVVLNIGAFNITLTNQDAASTAANRFLFGANVTLTPEASTLIWYDDTSLRWRSA